VEGDGAFKGRVSGGGKGLGTRRKGKISKLSGRWKLGVRAKKNVLGEDYPFTCGKQRLIELPEGGGGRG